MAHLTGVSQKSRAPSFEFEGILTTGGSVYSLTYVVSCTPRDREEKNASLQGLKGTNCQWISQTHVQMVSVCSFAVHRLRPQQEDSKHLRFQKHPVDAELRCCFCEESLTAAHQPSCGVNLVWNMLDSDFNQGRKSSGMSCTLTLS